MPLFTEHLIIIVGYSISRHETEKSHKGQILNDSWPCTQTAAIKIGTCTYNVTLKRVHVTIITVEKQWLLHNLCVFVALGIQHAMLMRQIAICGLYGSTIFFYIIS